MQAAALLRNVRTRNGLTQGAVAARAGTSQPVISAYEHGRRDPSIATLERLVRAAGETLEIGARRRSEQDLPPPVDLDHHNRRLLDVLSLADAIPHRRTGTLEFPRISSR